MKLINKYMSLASEAFITNPLEKNIYTPISAVYHGARLWLDSAFSSKNLAYYLEKMRNTKNSGEFRAIYLKVKKGLKKDEVEKTKLVTILFKAIEFQDKQVVSWLKELGIDINSKDALGRTPCHIAASSCSKDFLKFLIDLGGDVLARNYANDTLLHATAGGNKYLNFCYLLDKHPQLLNLVNSFGHTAGHIVSKNKDPIMMRKLMAKNPDFGIKDLLGQNMTHFSVEKQADFGDFISGYWTTGALCRISNDSLRQRDYEGCTPVFSAVREGGLAELKILYKNGALLDLKNNSNQSLLHIAAERNHADILKFLLSDAKCKALLYDTEKETGYSPLHFAVKNNAVEAAQVLLDYDADLYQADLKGETVFHLAAAENGSTKMQECLFENIKKKGAYSVLKVKSAGTGATAFHIAASSKNYEFIQNVWNFLMTLDPSKIEIAACAEQLDPNEKPKNLLNDVDSFGNTALHSCILSGDLNMFKILDGLIDKNAINHKGENVLDLAVTIAGEKAGNENAGKMVKYVQGIMEASLHKNKVALYGPQGKPPAAPVPVQQEVANSAVTVVKQEVIASSVPPMTVESIGQAHDKLQPPKVPLLGEAVAAGVAPA